MAKLHRLSLISKFFETSMLKMLTYMTNIAFFHVEPNNSTIVRFDNYTYYHNILIMLLNEVSGK